MAFDRKAYREAHKEKTAEYNKAYRKANTEKMLALTKDWVKRNPDKSREHKKKYRDAHKEERKAYNKQWAQKNAGKVTNYSVKYQLAKINATPKWLSAEQLKEIEAIYVNRPEGFHVDHKVPLNGKTVCGLHVPWNLQYLPATENIKKSNKL